MDIRAYINPQPALSEADQRRLVDPLEPAEIYVETRNETREDWIESLRPGSVALVPKLFVLAKAIGRKDGRLSDLLLAKDEIHGAGSHILEADTGHRSSEQWNQMLARANDDLSGAVKSGKVGKQPFTYTEAELLAMRAVMESRKYHNWPERSAAIKAKGIKVPGRTWALSKLPQLVDKVPPLEPTKLPRRQAARVYFIQDGDAVNIGHSVSPERRMAGITTCRELRLLLMIPGGPARERELHKKFAKFRVKGEWFQLAPPILDFIENAKLSRKRR